MSLTSAYVGRGLPESRPRPELRELLADDRRRTLVRRLADASPDTEIELDDLALSVAAREYDVDPEAVDEDTYERVLVDIHEAHLPRLADADLVEVDRDGGIFVSPDADLLAMA